MATVSSPLVLPKDKFNSVMSIAISSSPDEVYIPCGGDMRSHISDTPSADIAVISIKPPTPEITYIDHKTYEDNRTLAIMHCHAQVPVAFNATYFWDINRKFTGHLTAMMRVGQGFQVESDIALPDNLGDGVVFGNVHYDKYNSELYFTAEKGGDNGAETLLFIVDENTVTFKKTIPLNFAIDIRQQIAVSSTRHIYIPDGTVVLCLSNTDEIMGQLTIPTHDSPLGELLSVGGVCVDNANNRLLVNCFYETIGGLYQFAIAEFSTKDNRFIRLSGIDFKSDDPVSDAYVNEKKQTVIVLARNRIYVYSLRDYSVLNVFLLGEETYLQASNYIDASDTLVVAYTQGSEVIEVITLKNVSQQ